MQSQLGGKWKQDRVHVGLLSGKGWKVGGSQSRI